MMLSRWVAFLFLSIFCWYVHVGLAQEISPNSDWPYRRIFVPQSHLKEMDLTGYSPLSVVELNQILSKPYENQTIIDGTSQESQKSRSELISSHYVASLDGADLVSERSRLVFMSSGNQAERVTLQPFSLAIHPRTGIASLSKAWTFDEQGNPRVPMTRTVPTIESVTPKLGESTHWFGWSSRSQSRSSPYRLYFSLSVPRCADSCLVLILPPKATVQDSNAVATKLESWQQATDRLGEWPENTVDSKAGLKLGDSIWLIELGGVQNPVFSIALSETDRSSESGRDEEVFRYSQLIRSQRIEHLIAANEIRTACDAELSIPSRQSSPIRLSVPANSRIRKFRVDGVDANWEMVQGKILWRPPAGSSEQSSSASAFRISAEFLTPIPSGESHEIDAPRITFEQSYVAAGLTLVKAGSNWSITSVRCDAAKLSDPSSSKRNASHLPLEYTWQSKPPACSIGLQINREIRQADCFTRMVCESQGIRAASRVRLQFLDQDTSFLDLMVGKPWSVLRVEAVDRADPISFKFDAASGKLRIDWERIQKNRVADLDIQMLASPAAMDTSDAFRTIQPSQMFEWKGWEFNHFVAIEETGPFKFYLNESVLDRLVNEDTLPEWMRRQLTRSTRHYLIRIPPDDQSVTNSKDDLELRWSEPMELRSAEIQTQVIATDGKMILLQHEFRIHSGNVRDPYLEILLPFSKVQWSIWDSDDWKSIDPSSNIGALITNDSSRWRFQFPSPEDDHLLRAKSLMELDSKSTASIELPQILNHHITSHTVQSSRQLLVHRNDEYDRWSFDSAGERILNLATHHTDDHPTRLSVQRTQSEGWNAYFANLDVSVDLNGSQTAQCEIRTKLPLTSNLTVGLGEGWKPLEVHYQSAQGRKNAKFELHDRMLSIAAQSSEEYLSEISIVLVGPELAMDGSSKWLPRFIRDFVPFRWPDLDLNMESLSVRRRLMLPPELSVEGISRIHEPTPAFPIWQFSNALSEYLGFGNWNQSVSDNTPGPSLLSSKRTVDRVQWRTAHVENVSTLSHSSVEATAQQKLYITRSDNHHSAFIIVFAIAAWFTPKMILRNFRTAVLVAFLIVLLCNLGLESPAYDLLHAGLIGMCFGFSVLALYLVLSARPENDSASNRRQSTRWLPWNVKDDLNDSNSTNQNLEKSESTIVRSQVVSTLGSLIVWMLIGTMLDRSHALLAVAHAQTPQTATSIYSILIPVDEKGALSGNDVYVQDEMRSLFFRQNTKGQDEIAGSKVQSARYFLKLGGRTKLDQLTISYEFLVGDDLAPIRFPFADHIQAMRFVVDSNEINPLTSSRLRRIGQEWIWVPERAGKRAVQILGQPRLTQPDSTSKESGVATYQIDLPLVPSSNATIDVEAEPPLGIDLVSRGQMGNPNSGRYTAMLGGLDRLQCKITTPVSSPSVGFSTPLDVSESCTMHTEILLQNDVLQAKTVFDFPKGIPLSKQVEIEAESSWIPVGSDWGDAHWVDVRSGSTLSRRRYVLEWNTPPGALSANTRERHVSIYWIPQSGHQNLNVLFAECRNHRMKYGNLRFSRIPGADWSLEGINTWTPASHPDERLDWTELGVFAPATTLRIPTNGGFAVLKNRINLERLKARVFSKWSIDSNGELLNCRIELLGSASSDTLLVEIPAEYAIQEVLDRDGSLRFLQQSIGNKLRVQILEDRKALETGIIELQFRRVKSQQKSSWNDIPWIELPQVSESDQSLEYVLSDRVAIRLDNAPEKVIYGKWPSQSIETLTRSSANLEQDSSIPRRYESISRAKPVHGLLAVVCENIFRSDTAEVEVRGTVSRDLRTKPFFVIEIPNFLKDHWESDLRINPIACPDPSKAWIQVSLPDTEEATNSSYFSISLDVTPEDEVSDVFSIVSQIRAINEDTLPTYFAFLEEPQRIPSTLLPASDAQRNLVIREARLPSTAAVHVMDPNRITSVDATARKSPAKLSVAQCVHEPLTVMASAGGGTSRMALDSKYWFGDKEGGADSRMELEWELPENSQAVAVISNGQAISFSQSGRHIRASPIFLGVCHEIVLTTMQSIAVQGDDSTPLFAPQLVSHQITSTVFLDRSQKWKLTEQGHTLELRPYEESLIAIASQWQHLLTRSIENLPETERSRGSDWELWFRHWIEQSATHLAAMKDFEPKYASQYTSLVRQFHKLLAHAEASSEGEFDERWKNRIASEWDALDSESRSVQDAAPINRQDRWYSLAVGCFLLVLIVFVARNFYKELMRRPWWYLILVGSFVWIWSGWIAPLLALGTLGLLFQIDTYLIANERLRRIGTRGPR